jgi:hypothetical protein
MKSRPGPDRLALLLALAIASPLGAALVPTEWSHRQDLLIASPGLVRVELTAASFDAASLRQEDLRVIDPVGREIPSLLDRPPVPAARTVRPADFGVKIDGGATVLTLTTGTSEALAAVTLETPHPFFLRSARVETSDDGVQWTQLDSGLPLFRQWGAEKLTLPLGQRAAAFVRIVISGDRAGAMPFTGAWLSVVAAPTPALLPVNAQITRREEFAGETVLTLALDGAHLPLAALHFTTNEPLFMRRVTVTVREVRDAVPGERTVGAGTVYRVALDHSPAREQLEVPLNFTAPTREVLVHIFNGDSPPLVLDGVRFQRWPVNLLFVAPAFGRFALLSGNPQAGAPHYDLAGFAEQMRVAPATSLVPGAIEPMPRYRPRESLAEAPLPDVPLAGAPLDAASWPDRRPVKIERPGVQELELDLEALAHSRRDYGDLRLLRDGNQIPYVLELPGLARSLNLTPVAAPDPKRRSVSVWQLKIPHAGAPLRRLVLASKTPLFSREFRIYERASTPEGRNYENLLASGGWSRTPEPDVPLTRVFDLLDRVRTDTLWIETDNGDNPAITLDQVQAVYPVARLIFKVADTESLSLIYGNQEATAPSYDLRLVAEKLLTASRNVATLGAGEPNPDAHPMFAGLKGGYVFWGALALVVVVLLVVVSKLLPKPPLI